MNGWDVCTLHSDPCVFVILSPDNTVSMMLLYVDDCHAQGERESDLEFIRDTFGERFGIKNVDPHCL